MNSSGMNQSSMCMEASSMLHNLTLHGSFGCASESKTQLDVRDLHSRVDSFNPSSQLFYIGYPILLGVGLIGNTFLPIFLWKTQPRTTYLCYMTAICVSNTLVLMFQFPGYIATYVLSMHYNYDLRNFMLFSLGLQMFGRDAFSLTSNWTVVAFSMERVIVISNPLKFHARRRKRFALVIMAVIIVAAGAVSIPATVAYYKMSKRMGFFDHKMDQCPGMMSMMENIERIEQILILVEGTVVNVLVPVITFLILMVTTLLLIFVLIRHRRHRQNMVHNGQLNDDTSQQTFSLLRAVAIYFFTQIPYAVYLFLLTLSMPPKCFGIITMATETLATSPIQFLFLTYHALTFLNHNNLLTELLELCRRHYSNTKRHSQTEVLVTPGTSSTSL